MTRFRPTVAVVDLGAVRHNVRTLDPRRSQVMAVVKAGGYGHGDIAVARAAVEAGATWLGVALVEEGIRLRDRGMTTPILVLSEFPRGSETDALAAGLTPTLYTLAGLRSVARAAADIGQRPGVHVKVDTGMHRVGLDPRDAEGFVRSVVDAGLPFEGLWTHFAKAEEPGDPSVAGQLKRFGEVSQRLAAVGLRPHYRHAANSAAILANSAAHLDLVRLGLAMYGLLPGPRLHGIADLKPAMAWRSAVSFVKRLPAREGISYGLHYRLERASTVATVPVGYADGYARLLSNRGSVLIRGRRYPIAGVVTMDQIMIDCGDDTVEPGDEVTLMGPQGKERLAAEELAGWMETVNYEVVTRVSERVPREYVEPGDG